MIFFYRFSRLIKENAKNTKNLTTILTTCHMTSCEWWRSIGRSTPSSLITRHMVNCDKSCKKKNLSLTLLDLLMAIAIVSNGIG